MKQRVHVSSSASLNLKSSFLVIIILCSNLNENSLNLLLLCGFINKRNFFPNLRVSSR